MCVCVCVCMCVCVLCFITYKECTGFVKKFSLEHITLLMTYFVLIEVHFLQRIYLDMG